MYSLIEIGDRSYTVTPIPSFINGVAYFIVLSRRDGTEPIIVAGHPSGGVRCSCREGRDESCKHVSALRQAGFLQRGQEDRRPSAVQPAAPAGLLGSLFGMKPKKGGFLSNLLGHVEEDEEIPTAVLLDKNGNPIQQIEYRR